MDGPLHQELPLHIQLSAPSVLASDQFCLVPGLLLLTNAEVAGGAFGEGCPPRLNLSRMDFLPGGHMGNRFLTLYRLRVTGLQDLANQMKRTRPRHPKR